jgi:ubiquinone/menaquinone biosynthesis C-methylase UbiE
MPPNHLKSPECSFEEPQPTERQAVLDRFAEQPDDSIAWQTAYSWVRSEGDHPWQSGTASDIPAEELIAMAETARATDQYHRYDLMTRRASNGKLWFDIIEGFSMDSIRQVSRNTVEAWAQWNQAPFVRTLDLGTGTGKSLAVLEQNSVQVIGVDRNQALLDVAKERAGDSTSLVHADITRLPFCNESFDLISSLGIEGSLDKASQVAFYTELARVLMPGATYISAFYNYPDMPSDDIAKITQTSKAMLADMICDTVSGGISITERLDEQESKALFTQLGLDKEYYLDANSDETNQAIIQVITKI